MLITILSSILIYLFFSILKVARKSPLIFKNERGNFCFGACFHLNLMTLPKLGGSFLLICKIIVSPAVRIL